MKTYRYWSKECIKDYHRYFSLKWLEYDIRGILSYYHLKRRYVETKANKRLSVFWKFDFNKYLEKQLKERYEVEYESWIN